MSIIKRHIEHLDAMQNSVEDVLREILIEHKSEIVALVKYDQLAKGKNSYDKPLSWSHGSGFYASSTQSFATRDKVRTPKRAGSAYNFQWTGETFDNMQFKLTEKAYDIFTIGTKQKLLEELYGDIFELTEKHNNYVNNKILEPELVKWIEQNWWKLP